MSVSQPASGTPQCLRCSFFEKCIYAKKMNGVHKKMMKNAVFAEKTDKSLHKVQKSY